VTFGKKRWNKTGSRNVYTESDAMVVSRQEGVRTMERLLCATLLIVLVGVSTTSANSMPPVFTGTNTVHASLIAYSNAVVTATDAETGITVTVEPNSRELKATGKDGSVLWKVDVVKAWGNPAVGKAVIRHLAIRDGKVSVTVGKHMGGTVDLKTGKAILIGED
jgi:hypothetical protein